MRGFTHRRVLRALGLLFVPLVAVALACGPTPKPTPTAVAADAGNGCTVPDLAALDQSVAQRRLVDLGLMPVRVDEENAGVPAGVVIRTDPAGGTVLASCEGEVKVIVSLGTGSEVVAPTATPRPSPTSTPESAAYPEGDDLNWFYTSFYEETFDLRNQGFRPEWTVEVAEGGSSATSDTGMLETQGSVAALIGDSSWFNYRVTFGGADYTNVTEFYVFARTQDVENYMGLQCYKSEGSLMCSGMKVVGGELQALAGFQEAARFCADGQMQCDITFEAIGDQYRVLVNESEVGSFSDDTFTQGAVGFGVDGTWVVDYIDVLDPGGGAQGQYTLFRDDFDTGRWGTGVTDGDFAVSDQVIEEGRYTWDVEAKDGVVVEEIHELNAAFDPEGFPYHFDYSAKARQVSGPAGAAHGLLFRCQDYDNFYYFRVDDQGNADFYMLVNKEWTRLGGPFHTDSFELGAENVLRVVAEGDRFSFWINGYFIFEATDSQFSTGGIGLATELSNAGEQAVFQFDEVRIGVTP